MFQRRMSASLSMPGTITGLTNVCVVFWIIISIHKSEGANGLVNQGMIATYLGPAPWSGASARTARDHRAHGGRCHPGDEHLRIPRPTERGGRH